MGKPLVLGGRRLAGPSSPHTSGHDFQWGTPLFFVSTTETELGQLKPTGVYILHSCLKISVPKQTKPDVQPAVRQQQEDEHMALTVLTS